MIEVRRTIACIMRTSRCETARYRI